MLDRLYSRWLQLRSSDDQVQDQDRSRGTTLTTVATSDTNAETGLPLPVGAQESKSASKYKSRWKGVVSGASISHPIRSSPVSLTGLDAPEPLNRAPAPAPNAHPALVPDSSSVYGYDSGSERWNHPHPLSYPNSTSYPHPQPSTTATRSGPSNVEWVVGHDEFEGAYVGLPQPAVVRSDSNSQRISRSASAPFLSTPPPSSSSPKGNLRLVTRPATATTNIEPYSNASATPYANMNPFANPVYTLPTGFGPSSGSGSFSTDVYNHAYNYPLAKQLSPIIEQDYISPASISERASRSGSGSVGSLGYGYGYGAGHGGSQGGDSVRYSMSGSSARSVSGSSSGASNGNLNGRGGTTNNPSDSMKSETARTSSPLFSMLDQRLTWK